MSESVDEEPDGTGELLTDKNSDVMFTEQQQELEWDNSQGSLVLPSNRPEKRLRNSDESSEDKDGVFTMVINRKAKRFIRSMSEVQKNKNEEIILQGSQESVSQGYEVCMISEQPLPKQFKMAKLFRELNIVDVQKIKYKSPYKAFILFEKRDDAEKMIKCTKLEELKYRCNMALELSCCYGIVKQIELDIEDKEIMESFSCNFDIISIRRLKRLTEEGKWADSETVRFCFKSTTLPQCVTAFGCRFKVEPYIFPVSQCSRCWRFGHSLNKCPTKKVICPKCGKDHPNCDTKAYICINCKNEHMAIDKSCPLYAKERDIRKIMSEECTTYKKALQVYLIRRKEYKNDLCAVNEGKPPNISSDIKENGSTKRLYRDVVLTRNSYASLEHTTIVNEHEDDQYEAENSSQEENCIEMTEDNRKRVKRVKEKRKSKDNKNEDYQFLESEKQNVEDMREQETKEKEKKKKISFDNSFSLIQKLIETCWAEGHWFGKLLKWSFNELVKFLKTITTEGNLISKFLGNLVNG